MYASIAVRKGFGVLAVLMTGMLAGILFGSGMDQFAAAGLPESGWLSFRNVNSWVFPTIMPWVFNGTLLALIVATVLARTSARLLFAVAAVLCAVAIFVTIRIEVPLNHRISSWTVGAAPPEWMAVRAHWLRMHLVRTMVGMVAFLSASIGLARL
jgi:hypothetical protein